MSLRIIRLLGLEANVLNTATSSFSNAHLLRVYNPSASPVVLCISNTTANVGTITVYSNNELIIEKKPIEVVNAAANTLVAVAIAYRN